MITEVVLFKLPLGMSREDFLRRASETIGYWQSNAELVRKTYIYDGDRGYGGGMYLWPTLEAAKRWHGADFRDRIFGVYGSEPKYTYYETPWVIDNRVPEFVDYSDDTN
jgi:hypothetical protein